MIPSPNSTVVSYLVRGIPLVIMDRPNSLSASWIADELAADDYGLEQIDFHPGDVVIDVGAHVGMFAIYLAKRFPGLSILAFEPEPTNFNNLQINLALNGISNVVPHMIAITKDARPVVLTSPSHNSGGASIFLSSKVAGAKTTAASETLDEVFESRGLEKCKLLKIDCEGAEHEVLSLTKALSKVEWLSGEIHTSKELERRGYSRDSLVFAILKEIPPKRLALKFNEL